MSEDGLGRGVVVIPAYGKSELTLAVTDQCLKESHLVDVLVVDNAGTLPDIPGASVLRPGRNLGWLRGTNHGLRHALGTGVSWFACLNNDTTLSPEFFAGLRAALNEHPADLVAPCYDDVVKSQNAYYTGAADQFPAAPEEIEARLIDGTAFAMTSALVSDTGYLDEAVFGRRGWGAIDDYILRVRALGGTCQVTRRAYLQHATGSTAHSIMSSYERYAYAEMRRGMRRKWGRDWRASFPELAGGPDSLRQIIGDEIRNVEDRFGLAETWVGRR